MGISISVEGEGYIHEDKAMAKWQELDAQIKGLESTITGHENSVIECRRQITEVRKLAEPYRKALLRRLGGVPA